jgi:gliding motility-associated-like protein
MQKKFILPVLIFAIVFITGFNTLKATHLMGGNVTYVCVGKDSFMIRLSLYRDCSGVSAPTSPSVTIESTCGNVTVPLTMLPGSGNDITPLCPGWPSPCTSPSSQVPVGVEEYLYEGLFVVPSGAICTNWTVSWSSCCRNNAITNLLNPGSQSFLISSLLKTGQTPCNSSPEFLNSPVPYFCANQPVSYNHGVHDPDGDSLVFSIVTCQQSTGGPIVYAPPYTGTQPLKTTASGVQIDARTGTITFTATIPQISVMCVQIDEYRNGVKIGQIVRDIQIVISNCNNQPPLALGMNGGARYDTAVCPGQYLEFDVFTTDTNKFQTISMTWDNGIPQADTFIISSAQFPVGTFKWTPTLNDIGFHFFTVRLQDDGCPTAAINIFAYVVEVRFPDIDLGPDRTVCDGDTISIVTSSTVDFNQFTWTPTTGIVDPTVADASFSPSVTTTYVLNATNGFCNASDTITINVDQKPNLTVPQTQAVCIGDSIDITASGNAAKYVWSTGDSSATINVKPTNSSIYRVVAISSGGCLSNDSVIVDVNPLPVIDAGSDNGVCNGDSVILNANGTGSQYIWQPGSITDSTAATTIAFPSQTTVYTVINIDANNCKNLDTVKIVVFPGPPISAFPDTTITVGSSVTVASGNSNASSYLWSPADGIVPPGTVNDKEIVVAPLITTTYTVEITDANGCRSRDSVTIIVLPSTIGIPNAFTPNGDGLNDELKLLPEDGFIEIIYFRIYNRWGEMIFETLDPKVGWDGTYKGEEQSAGSYTYVVIGLDPQTKEQYTLKGNVTLIR